MTTRLGRFVDRLGYSDLILALALYITLTAVFFYYSPFGGGFSTSQNMKHLAFSDALYFSVVTFSSLGYGDYVPLGVNRILAGISVFVGLAFFAVAIGKISSERTQATLTLIHSSDVQRRLDHFRAEISRISKRIRIHSEQYSSVDPKDLKEAIEDGFRIFANFRNYIIFNINQSNSIIHGNEAVVASVMRESVDRKREFLG
ncbi:MULTISPECIES: potassium channel family protein, partial [unclassified Labrenzia]|uniref:potassium channel family protein n=1 Tax=unclassified Labrenzia TaxID=2648686 RepID=UPI0013780F5F